MTSPDARLSMNGLVVIELAGSVAGAYAGKLFADYGATVLKVEPPGGDPLRHAGEDWGGTGTTFVYLNTGKRSVVLDLETRGARGQLERLLGTADVLIESSEPDPLRPAVTDPPLHLVAVRISPFGGSGPYAQWRSNEFTDQAIGGHSYLNGEPEREPIRRPGFQSHYQAGVHGFIGAMAALRARDEMGAGQIVEVSHHAGLASMHQHTTVMWSQAGHILRRVGNRQPGFWHPVGIYRCRDGYVSVNTPTNQKLQPLLAVCGLASIAEDERFALDVTRGEHKREFDEVFGAWLRTRTVAEVIELGQQVFAPVGPVPDPLEVLEDDHLAARDYWRELDGDPTLRLPRGPFRIEGLEPRIAPPPALGECDPASIESRSRSSSRPAPHDAPALADGPLTGVRVLDLTRVWAGPIAARMLGDLGADVIRVEALFARGPRELPEATARLTHLFPEHELGERPWNREASFNDFNRNKRGITLQLNDPRGKALFERLVERSDVVLENYSPRVMPQLGLDDARLRALNRSVIHVAMPGYGASGPRRNWTSLGPLIEAGSGLSSLMGYPDGGPLRSGVAWPDPVTGLHAVSATLIALRERDADPEHAGRSVEVSMIESMVPFLGEQLLAAQVRGAAPPRRGNREPGVAPQGCYPCAGDDQWIAVSILSDEQWRALCEIAGFGEPAASMTLEQRERHHDEIDRLLGRWTRTSDSVSLAHRLQQRGVIAVPVADARTLVEDPQLEATGFWAELDHPDVGRRRYPGLAITLQRTPATYRVSAPLLGQHNVEVLGGMLGLSEGELSELEAEGVIGTEPPAE